MEYNKIKKTKSLMIQGTTSNAGKSIITAGLCRLFFNRGYKVAPYKSQNMALNSFVTINGEEMGRAQVLQAQACKIEPKVEMNPVLLKPSSETGTQLIVNGKAIGNLSAKDYYTYKKELAPIVLNAYEKLTDEYDLIIIEGAGSPAEINLKENDIVNMFIAKETNSPVILVGDIDRGGLFAHFVGTIELLDEVEKNLVKGFIINKFRGDRSLLTPAIDFLENKTKKEVLGIVNMLNMNLPDEDSVSIKTKNKRTEIIENEINIAVINLPYISNFTDFDSLRIEDDVNINFINEYSSLDKYDLIIIPGSKNTIYDLKFLFETKISDAIKEAHKNNIEIIGICGGYQMLGNKIIDKGNYESNSNEAVALSLLNLTTEFKETKILSQTKAIFKQNNLEIKGYEIHQGVSFSQEEPFVVSETGEIIGTGNSKKNVWGTYLHGIFDNDNFRNELLNKIRKRKNIAIKEMNTQNHIDNELDKLADYLENNLDIDKLIKIIEDAVC